MKFPRNTARQIVILIGIGTFGQAARAVDLSGLYFGGDVGRSQIDYDLSRYEGQLQGQADPFGTLDFTSSSPHTRSNAWWADAGYMVWPNVGVEASFLHLGELTDRDSGNYTATGGTPRALIAITTLRSSGPALAAVFRVPLIESLDMDIRIGDYLGRTTLVNGMRLDTYTVTTQSAHQSSLLVGVGAAYNFGGHWSARLDYLRVNKAGDNSTVGTYNAGLASLGMRYTF